MDNSVLKGLDLAADNHSQDSFTPTSHPLEEAGGDTTSTHMKSDNPIQSLHSTDAPMYQEQDQAQSQPENEQESVDEKSSATLDENQELTDYQLLRQRREEYKTLIEASDEEYHEGDAYYAVSKRWLDTFTDYPFEEDDTNIESAIGQINTSQLVDDTGLILNNDVEREFVSEPVFLKLCDWFGLDDHSEPIERRLIFDHNSQQYRIEVYPIYIIPHILCAAAETVNRYRLADAKPFLISSRRTARELKEEVKKRFGITKGTTRIWQIRGDSYDLPKIFLPQGLNRIVEKTLIPAGKKLGSLTLAEKNIANGDILIEIQQPDLSYLMDTSSELILSNGLVGLNNLGNTCYMNSALQCLVHIPELANYFMYDYFEKELNIDNPLGNNGKLAIAFGTLIKNLFDERLIGNSSSYAPRDFKYTVGYFNSMFSDYHQQDSQELLAFLLDGLHEDLNRILKKPYVEKPELENDKVHDPEEVRKLAAECWKSHKLRNNSIIIDLFVGLYKSTLVCPECNKVSITFDPYNDLTLPLPVNQTWTTKVKILLEEGYPKEFEVELKKSSTFADLKAYIADRLSIPMNELIAVEIFRSQVYKNFEARDSDTRYLPISELISSGDDIWFYQIDHRPGDLVVPVFNTLVREQNYNMSKPFGIPFFITVSEEERCSYGIIREKLEKRYSQLSTYNYFEKVRSQSKSKHTIDDFPLLKKSEDIDESDNISLADPDLPGNYAFSIKLFDSSREMKRGNAKYNRNLYSGGYQKQKYRKSEEDDDDDSLWIPQTNDNFRNLPDILEKLSPRKREFYTYQGVVSSDDNATEQLTETEDTDSSKKSTESWELVPETDHPPTSITSSVSTEGEMILGPLALPTGMEIDDAVDSDADYAVLDADSKMHSDEDGVISASPVSEPHPAANGENLPNDDLYQQEAEEEDAEEEFYNKPLIDEKNAIVCEWDQQLFDTFFTGIEEEGEGGRETWSNLEVLSNLELEENRRKRAENAKKHITLDDCINMFCTPEVLGENDLWYCPNCKEHREATKKIEIWTVPDILTIQLKRFESTKSFSDKIDVLIDFPIEGLDMTKYVVGNNGESLIYDLFAVDNHYGGLGGGHYTSYAKNFVDGRWYYYDDSRVTAANPENAIKGSAYLLFYRRRQAGPLGGEFFQTMFNEIRHRFESDNTSQVELHDISIEETNLDKSPTPLESPTGLNQDGSNRIGSQNASDSQASPPTSSEEIDDEHSRLEAVNDDDTSMIVEAATEGSSDNAPKRRKKMFLRSNVLDSNFLSPMSDNDDNVSTYSSSALAPDHSGDLNSESGDL
ncbi:hypothetical protein CANARDRAFT_27100 [[Candida] arabinofermentans NRRL YB-2248]|uniref:ubiquitinyl hydrolase 1 n=1 Tax=[Candida] arabinofermentans NRRL YB-2248 TaxID=983967 RepID=A0A1E4T4N1_9ASCO|nr:hypothetical protein CANARDRAFT_27100 [[Candida] arabinofermentans NRRL YB-2248]